MTDEKPSQGKRRREEQCCVCDERTGRAGIADDSLYHDFPDGCRHGPLCVDCYNAAEPYIDYWQSDTADLRTQLAAAQAIVGKLQKTGDGLPAIPGVTRVFVVAMVTGRIVGSGILFSVSVGINPGDGLPGGQVRFEDDEGRCVGGSFHLLCNCYSTLEAAEAAKKEGEES